MDSHDTRIALPLRPHTILGVCEAIGEDFGFNPVFLRIPLGALVVVNLLWALGAYVFLGAAVLASRLLFPERVATEPMGVTAAPANEQEDYAKAA
jgi:phage shock protein C